MLQEFLTIEQAAERLKDRGYTEELVQAAVAAGRIPYHVRNLVIVVPFPEADSFFPPIAPEPAKEPDPEAEAKHEKAPKKGQK